MGRRRGVTRRMSRERSGAGRRTAGRRPGAARRRCPGRAPRPACPGRPPAARRSDQCALVDQRHAVVEPAVVHPLLDEVGDVPVVPVSLTRALTEAPGTGDDRRRAVPTYLARRRHDRRRQRIARRDRRVGLDLHARRPCHIGGIEPERRRDDGRVVQDRRRVEVRLPIVRAVARRPWPSPAARA